MEDQHLHEQPSIKASLNYRPMQFVLLLFVALASTWSLLIPPYENLDEQWHYPFVKHVADGHGLPIQQAPPAHNVARQEGSQPPLYYLAAGLITSWIDTSEPRPTIWVNPHARIGIPGAVGNKNMAIHSEVEQFPYRGSVLAVHVARILSIILAAVAVVGNYLVVLQILPGWKPMATVTAAAGAFIPSFVFVSASVNNDNLVNAVAPFVLLTAVGVVRRGCTRRRAVKLGVLLGIGALSKLSALGLLPLAGLALLCDGHRSRSVRRVVENGMITFGIAAIISGWWYVRNLVLYNEPLGIERMLDVAGRRSLTVSGFVAELEGLKFNFWALFGGVNVLADPFVYDVLLVVTVLAGIGLIQWIARRGWREQPTDLVSLICGLVWLATISVSFARWTSMTQATQGRLIYPALAICALLLTTGLYALAPRRLGPKAALSGPALLAGGLFVLSAVAPFRYILPAYAEPLRLPISAVGDLPNPTSMIFGNRIELLGYQTEHDDGSPVESLRPGDRLAVTFYWRKIGPIDRDYSLFVQLLGPQGEPFGQVDTYPGEGTYPTTRWKDGEVIVDRVRVDVLDGPVPIIVQPTFGFYRLDTMERLPVVRGSGEERRNDARLGHLRICAECSLDRPRPELGPLTLERVDIERGSGTTWRVTPGAAGSNRMPPIVPGETVTVALHWLVNVRTETDYTAFVHVLGDSENPKTGNLNWAQSDARPRDGQYPTPFWLPGERVVDRHTLTMDPAAPAGEYQLVTGFYDLRNMQHLAFPEGHALYIGTFDLGD